MKRKESKKLLSNMSDFKDSVVAVPANTQCYSLKESGAHKIYKKKELWVVEEYIGEGCWVLAVKRKKEEAEDLAVRCPGTRVVKYVSQDEIDYTLQHLRKKINIMVLELQEMKTGISPRTTKSLRLRIVDVINYNQKVRPDLVVRNLESEFTATEVENEIAKMISDGVIEVKKDLTMRLK